MGQPLVIFMQSGGQIMDCIGGDSGMGKLTAMPARLGIAPPVQTEPRRREGAPHHCRNARCSGCFSSRCCCLHCACHRAGRCGRSAEQRTARPNLPTAPASLLSGEHHQPPEGEQANGFVNGYGSAANALRRANVKLAGWVTLRRCSANALATGLSAEGCKGEAIAAMDVAGK
jgi:hypothetical protein